VPTFPFFLTGVLKDRPDTTVVAELPLSIWPARVRVGNAGDHFDHEGEAPMEFYDELRVANRFIEAGGERYVVVEAQQHSFLPHVGLRLRRTSAQGV
jgi:hypothetical protein